MSSKKNKTPVSKKKIKVHESASANKAAVDPNRMRVGSQLDSDSLISSQRIELSNNIPSKPKSDRKSVKSPRAAKQKKAAAPGKRGQNLGSMIVNALNNERGDSIMQSPHRSDIDSVEHMSRMYEYVPDKFSGHGRNVMSDSLVSEATVGSGSMNQMSFTISAGKLTKNGKAVNYVIKEYHGKCFSIHLYVPTTDQKWCVFVPLTEALSELLGVWSQVVSAEQFNKLSSWLLSCTTLEFDNENDLIIGAYFDHKTFREQHVRQIALELQEIKKARGGSLMGSPERSTIDAKTRSVVEQTPIVNNGSTHTIPGIKKGNKITNSSKELMLRTYLGNSSQQLASLCVADDSYEKSHPGYTPKPASAMQLHVQAQASRRLLQDEVNNLKSEMGSVFVDFQQQINSIKEEIETKTAALQNQHSNVSILTPQPSQSPDATQKLREEDPEKSEENMMKLSEELNKLLGKMSTLENVLQSQYEQSRANFAGEHLSDVTNNKVKKQYANARVVRYEPEIPSSGSASSVEMHDGKTVESSAVSLANEGTSAPVAAAAKGETKGIITQMPTTNSATSSVAETPILNSVEVGVTDPTKKTVTETPVKNSTKEAVTETPLVNSGPATVQTVQEPVKPLQSSRLSGELSGVGAIGVSATLGSSKKNPRSRKREKLTKASAAHIIQSQTRRYLFNRKRAEYKGKELGWPPLLWVKEHTLETAVAVTSFLPIIAESCRHCVNTNRPVLVRKTLERFLTVIKDGDANIIIRQVPLEVVVKLLDAFSSVSLVADLGLNIWQALCKQIEADTADREEPLDVCSPSVDKFSLSAIGVASTDAPLSLSETKLQSSIAASGAPLFVLNVLEIHFADPKLTFKAAKCISLMSNSNPEVKKIFSTGKCHKLMYRVSLKHRGNPSVMECVVKTAGLLCANDEANQNKFRAVGMFTSLMTSFGTHYTVERLVIAYCKCFLVMTEGNEKSQLELSTPTCCKAFNTALVYHLNKSKVIERLLLLMNSLIKDNETVKCNILDNGLIESLLTMTESPMIGPKALMAVFAVIPNFLMTSWGSHRTLVHRARDALDAHCKSSNNSEVKRVLMYSLSKIDASEKETLKFAAAVRAVGALQLCVRRYLKRLRQMRVRETELKVIIDTSTDRNIMKECLNLAGRLRSASLAMKTFPKILDYFVGIGAEEVSNEKFSKAIQFFDLKDILYCGKRVANDAAATGLVLELLLYFATRSQLLPRPDEKLFVETLVDVGVVTYWKISCNSHMFEPKLCFTISKIILAYAGRSEAVRSAMSNAEWAILFHKMITAFKDDPSVLENLMRSLYELTIDSIETRDVFGNNGVCEVLTVLFTMHYTSHRLIVCICKAICGLTVEINVNNQNRFLPDLSYANVYVSAVSANVKNPKLNDQIYWAIYNIAYGNPRNMHLFAQAGLFSLLKSFLLSKDAPETILNQTLWAFSKLAPNAKAMYEGIDNSLYDLFTQMGDSHPSPNVRGNALKAIRFIFANSAASGKQSPLRKGASFQRTRNGSPKNSSRGASRSGSRGASGSGSGVLSHTRVPSARDFLTMNSIPDFLKAEGSLVEEEVSSLPSHSSSVAVVKNENSVVDKDTNAASLSKSVDSSEASLLQQSYVKANTDHLSKSEVVAGPESRAASEPEVVPEPKAVLESKGIPEPEVVPEPVVTEPEVVPEPKTVLESKSEPQSQADQEADLVSNIKRGEVAWDEPSQAAEPVFEHKIPDTLETNSGMLDGGVSGLTGSSMSQADAALVLQRTFTIQANKTRRSNAGGSHWVRETGLLRIMHLTSDFDIVAEGIRLSIANSSLGLARKSIARLSELVNDLDARTGKTPKTPDTPGQFGKMDSVTGVPIENSKQDIVDSSPGQLEEAKKEIANLSKSIRMELLINVFKPFVTDKIITEGLLVSMLLLLKKPLCSDSASGLSKRVEHFVELGGVPVVLEALKQHDGDPKLCFKNIRLLVFVTDSNNKAKAALASADYIKAIIKMVNKHKKGASVVEACCRTIINVAIDNNERSELVGECGITNMISQIMSYHCPRNTRIIVVVCRLMVALTKGDQMINKERFSSDATIRMLVDAIEACKATEKCMDAILTAITSVIGSHKPTKDLFFNAGIVTILMGILKDYCKSSSARPMLSRILGFIGKMVVANDDPTQGGGNAPETSQLLNLLKKLSENDKISSELKTDCKRTVAKITKTSSSSSKR